MQEITLESLKAFFKKPSKAQVEKESGLQQGYLTKILSGTRALTPETIKKLKPVLKKYHF